MYSWVRHGYIQSCDQMGSFEAVINLDVVYYIYDWT